MNKPHTWYVAFSPDKSDGVSGGRTTRTFASEAEAKAFALEALNRGWPASAGTLNPHQPKQTIGPLQLERWIETLPKGSASGDTGQKRIG